MKDFSVRIRSNFRWYFKECIKVTAGNYPNTIIFEIIIMMITWTNDPYQIVTYSLIGYLADIFSFCFAGMLAYPKAEIN